MKAVKALSAVLVLLGAGVAVASSVGSSTNATGTLAQFAATTSAQLFGVISDETGTGAVVAASGPTITNPSIVGIPDSTAAPTGYVGEVRRLTRVRSASIAMTTNTTCNIGAATCPATGGTQSIALDAGDWSCQAMMTIDMAATTCVQGINLAISTTSNTLPSDDVISVPTNGEAMYRDLSTSNMFCNDEFTKVIPPYQVTVANGQTKTLYLVGRTTFSTSTLNVYGSLECRRMR